MNRSRTFIGAAAMLLSVGLSLSACATAPGYDASTYPYAYNGYADYPYYDSFGYFGGYGHFHDGRFFDHGHGGHFVHVGNGFGHFGGHGFAARGGFGGHGGGFGGHGGGGHR